LTRRGHPIHDWTRVVTGAFHDFHNEWISSIKRTLNNGLLPPPYYAMNERPEAYARRRHSVVIRHSSDDRVVAIVKVVSPGNKASRHALRSFVDKALAFLDAGVHLLVIDLFPPGPRDPRGVHAAIWGEIGRDVYDPPEGRPLILAAYEAGDVRTAYVQPAAVGEELPEMPLFLEPGRYVPLPLELTYQTALEGVPRRWRAELGPA
jgi:hypothetical protein